MSENRLERGKRGVVVHQRVDQVKVTLAACTGTCANLTAAAGTGSFQLTPATTITDAAANTEAGSLTVSIRLF